MTASTLTPTHVDSLRRTAESARAADMDIALGWNVVLALLDAADGWYALAKERDAARAQLAASHEQIAILEAERRRLLIVAYEAYSLSMEFAEFDAVVDSTTIEALDTALLKAFPIADLFTFAEVGERITTALGGYAAMLEARKE